MPMGSVLAAWNVLILVLMDNQNTGFDKEVIAGSKDVLILVLMDNQNTTSAL